MSRFMSLALAGSTAIALSAATFTSAQSAPLPALNAAQVGGAGSAAEAVRYRGGRGYYGGGYGRGYGRGYGGYGRGYGRRGIGAGGALAAGAALGIIGGAIAASQAPRYGYYDRGYSYGAPAYGYGYAPVYGGYGGGYGYPAYGY